MNINTSLLQNDIFDEVLKVFRLPPSGFARKIFSPIFGLPVNRFAKIGSEFDTNTARYGFCRAAQLLLPRFIEKLVVTGESNIPKEGPLLLVSNHPGAYDSLAISSCIPRDDYKIVVGNIDFLKLLPNARKNLIFSYQADQTQARANVVRSSIQHLKQGGALLIFPSGQVDPDPAVQPGAIQSLRNWSRSIALMLREAPQTKLLITFVSGVLDKHFVKNPFLRLQKEESDRRRLAEFIQVIRQLVFGGRRLPHTLVSFTPTIESSKWVDVRDTRSLIENIKTSACDLYYEQLKYWKNQLDGYFQP
jgi:hypothetical protein